LPSNADRVRDVILQMKFKLNQTKGGFTNVTKKRNLSQYSEYSNCQLKLFIPV